jgi:hypothetical protein
MNLKRLASFLHDRIDEDDNNARRYSDPRYRRETSEVDAKRCALAAWEDTLRMPEYMNDPVQHATEHLLRFSVILPIAAIYADHAGYDRSWHVYPRPEDHASARERREREARQTLAITPPIADLLDRIARQS